MNIVPIPTKDEGNALYPLPADYFELSGEGQRLARVNACRQWLIPRKKIAELLNPPVTISQPELERAVLAYKAEAAAQSLFFFDTYYLHSDPETGFDPMFYDDEPLPTPAFHWDFVRATAVEAAVLQIAPRGSAKSTLIRKKSCHAIISRPLYKYLYCTSTEKVAQESAQAVRFQCYHNSRLQDDFGPEYGSIKLRPLRGEAPTGIEEFALSNGSSFATFSANSKIRGKRPRKFGLDDPEFDPTASTSMALIREYMRRLLFKVALPMVMRRECGIEWAATFISKRHFAYQAMMMKELLEEGKKVFRAEIAEFDYWHRILVRAATEDPATGKLVSCWPQMWPVDDADRKAQGLDKATPTLEEIRLRIGSANFNSEYMAKPGDSDESFFVLNEQKHGYRYSNVDTLLEEAPWKSSTIIEWDTPEKDGTLSKQRMPLATFCKYAKLFMVLDTSRTAKESSDPKGCAVLAVTPKNELFYLDLWLGKVLQPRLVKEAFRMADRWRCPRMAPEKIEDGIQLELDLKNAVAQRMQEQLGVEHLPVVKGFNPGLVDKTTKISSLLIRFEHSLIKYPFFKRGQPYWRDLFEQTEGFNPDAEDGGLQNDDALDMASMSQFVIKGRHSGRVDGERPPKKVIERLLEGETIDENGTPLAYQIDFNSLTTEDAYKILNAAKQRTVSESSKL